MTFKQLVKNSVDLQIYKYLSDKCENRYFNINEIEIWKGDKDFLFNARICVKNHYETNLYEIHGYIDEWCQIVKTYICYTRTYCKRLENGEFAKPEITTIHLYDKEMNEFKFDK